MLIETKITDGPRLWDRTLRRLSFTCERCGELGDHPCLEELVEALGRDEELLEAFWDQYISYRDAED